MSSRVLGREFGVGAGWRWTAVALALALGCHAPPSAHDGVVSADSDSDPGVVTADPALPVAVTPLTPTQRFRVLADLADSSDWIDAEAAEPAIRPDSPFSQLEGVWSESALDARHMWETTLAAFGDLRSDPFVRCGDDEACAQAEAEAFAVRAWRHPLSPEQQADVDANFGTWWDPSAAHPGYWFMVWAASSPWSTTRVDEIDSDRPYVAGQPPPDLDGWEIASRLSFALWDGPPDAWLRGAASAGELGSEEGVRAAVVHLLADPRFDATAGRFHREWIGVGPLDTRRYDTETYFSTVPDLDRESVIATLVQSLPTEIDLFVASVLHENGGRLRDLLTSRRYWVGDQSASLIYGDEIADAPTWTADTVSRDYTYSVRTFPVTFRGVEVPADRRGGLLTLPAFLALFGGDTQPSPVKRGVWVLDRLMCNPPAAPPAGVPALPAVAVGETNRARYAAHTENPGCISCHEAIDDVGFTFENYDALGRWRSTDHGHPVDASGAILGSDVDRTVDGALDLLDTLAGSPQVEACYATWWWRFMVGRDPRDSDRATLDRVIGDFHDSGGNISALIEDIAASDVFREHEPIEGTP